ncbi:amino acid ABC transporter [Rheinheimera sp. D18]|uniref:amino acid ABC transporter n=1 Tax=Rheinheimera sp. D18 TaxID=2545632 RepID=UPI00104AED9F|nr:amino acid ABC transporter [Rheinheimera sp. D18]QBL09464.1 amino acid ABC transporter [Rheinheimera sp. D18]
MPILLTVLAVLTPAAYAKTPKPVAAISSSDATLTFCYEDKQLLPYYAGNSSNVPELPGASIEHLRAAATATGVNLQLVRLPWLRCLQGLEDNSIDALIASVETERLHYTVYPKLANGEPDTNKAFNQLGLCLAHRFDNPIENKINNETEHITVARALGYRAISMPNNASLIGVHSVQKALDLVVSGRVDATTVLCQLNGINAKERYLNLLPVQLMYPPIHQSFGYLMLSNSFYQRYPQLSEQLWNALPKTLDKARYLEYLNVTE